MIQERIKALRYEMKKRNIDIYVVPSADYHQSEYVGDYFKCREFITGFTGSAGTAVIMQDKACLWTDGRYFIQAEDQLRGSEIHLQKMGEDGVPTIVEFLHTHLPENGCLGFDGRSVGLATGMQYETLAREKGGTIFYQEDLIDLIWEDRPAMPSGKVFRLDDTYAGVSAEDKIKKIRQILKEKSADIHLLTSLDDIGWLLNIRGSDVAYCPMLLSYLWISDEQILLYADKEKFDFFGEDFEKVYYDNYQRMTLDSLISNAVSISYTPSKADKEYNEFIDKVTDLFNRYNKEGYVTFHYKTEISIGKFAK
jgi:Xaa-Pro aminopeptidase